MAHRICAEVVRSAGIEYERLKTITLPTLVMTGTYDAAATPEECRKMAAQIPRSRYVELTAAHISPVEASDQFNQALRSLS